MGMLSRILKTSDDDDESEDEFQAEESGLLMAAPAAEGTPFEASPAPEVEGREERPTEAVAETEAEVDAEADGEAPAAESDPETEPAEEEDAEPEAQSEPESDEEGSEDSADDPLSAFRSTLGKRDRARALEQDLPDVAAHELLAEARSVLSIIAAEPDTQAPEEAEREAA
jgi:hypothetical protein